MVGGGWRLEIDEDDIMPRRSVEVGDVVTLKKVFCHKWESSFRDSAFSVC
jgi:hypothetical protein